MHKILCATLYLLVDEPEAGVQESGDSVFNYSRCVLWRGLLHMSQTDAEIRNNGDHMIADWRQIWSNSGTRIILSTLYWDIGY